MYFKIIGKILKNIRDSFNEIKNLVEFKNQMIDKSFYGLLEKNKILNYEPVSVRKNGNCLYESFSILYFNSNEFFYIFKLGSIFSLLEYQNFFRDLLDDLKY